eukprot:CAMPEP_0170747852 /NCGR_PEP_ID=MMETSP0437-20130122/9542_1 /TAXON_ID=0 /ORGANISM="Sexangularia sp." /LENGTH=183 /DNA_ID=CAMNT_0011086655 /DNA_START=84 /DNA_END=635 /DNA_ORIENTATION=+
MVAWGTSGDYAKLHTVGNRANAIGCFALMLIFLCALANSATRPLLHGSPSISLSFGRLEKLQRHFSSQDDVAIVTFNANVDLRPAWHWNTNIIFVYLVAEYTSNKNIKNQLVLYDRIVRSEDEATFRLDNAYAEYPLVDQGLHLRTANITFSMHWDIVPITGPLLRERSVVDVVQQFPSEYLA